jgi:cytochrome c oxidase assembly protein subunit 15
MGCPDWPRCFGLFVPPTEVSEIPAAFFETHPEYESKAFNAFQTWVEYLNRLVGALIGLFTLATAALSFAYRRKDKRIVVLSVLALFLTGFEGWLGKLVVDKNLQGGMVTIHMLVAIIILACLIVAVYLSTYGKAVSAPPRPHFSSRLKWLGVAVVLVTTVQILLGTQVREQVDEIAIALNGQARTSWIDSVDWNFPVHRIFAFVIGAMLVVWGKDLFQVKGLDKRVQWMFWGAAACFVLEGVVGFVLASQGLPPVLQPVHLLLANIMFALEFSILIYVLGVENWLAGKNALSNPLEKGNMIHAEH